MTLRRKNRTADEDAGQTARGKVSGIVVYMVNGTKVEKRFTGSDRADVGQRINAHMRAVTGAWEITRAIG
jgi:hypothetical protein